MTAVDTITTDPTPSVHPEPHSRRQVLCGLAVALVAPAAVVAACGSDTGSAPTTTTTGGGAPGSATQGGGALTALADVPDGGGVLVDGPSGKKVLLVRSGSTVKGLDPTCPHKGVTVAAPVGGTITCPAHNSTFDGATGALKGGPATTGLKEIPVKVDGANVVLA
ncbi:Rieske (2Fe-2S) protein [Actinokineospora iranica]|uniref:Ferredoxin subunit of nitrite reductase or a ring-hydroxylating dioxygenase n=1 Tax=Actinokineospora iranica TaxID=1271860 RepID=A0A1G6JA72_9PSEU|nr:Rieske (2Fe-2S) protein [Actinokineospora iranica]SDC15782.1 Ferredoxin subunit of nitrite reductase or a ring-hydroxylating dioxygenase [Actinokineospora iranica]